MQRPIYVFVRHCLVSENSANKPRPNWFTKEKAFKNLLKTTADESNVFITVILDADDPKGYFSYNYPVAETICIKGGSDAHSFINLLNHICARTDIPDDAIVYLLEDDFIHRNGWAKALREG